MVSSISFLSLGNLLPANAALVIGQTGSTSSLASLETTFQDGQTPLAKWQQLQNGSNGFSQPATVRRLSEIESVIEELLSKRGKGSTEIAYVSYDGTWFSGYPFNIPQRKIVETATPYKEELVAIVRLPSEGCILICIHERSKTDWNLFCKIYTPRGYQKLSRWEKASLISKIDEISHILYKVGSQLPFPCSDKEVFKMRQKPERELDPAYRQRVDAALLRETGVKESANFFARTSNKAELFKWLELEHEQGSVAVPLESVARAMDSHFQDHLSFLSLVWDILLRDPKVDEALRKRFEEILLTLGFTIGFITKPGDKERVLPPHKVVALGEADMNALANFLEELRTKGILIENNLDHFMNQLQKAFIIAKDYALLKDKEKITFTITLWRRDPKFDRILDLPPQVYRDLSTQVLVIRSPNGDIVLAYALRLFQNINGEIYLASSSLLDHWHTKEMILGGSNVLDKIEADLGIPEKNSFMLSGAELLNWDLRGFFPISAPLDIEQKISGHRHLRQHPHEKFFQGGTGSYEAMRLIEGGKSVMLSPLLPSFPLPKAFGVQKDFLFREIDPEPAIDRIDEYTFGFSGGTGRSVDYAVDFTAPDGTHYNHLTAIGVGQTFRARIGRLESRDGLMGLDEAKTRFYLSNLMHHVTGPHGFRTSLGVTIIDRGKERKGHQRLSGHPQTQAIVYELRREQLRLQDLENAPNPEARRLMLDHAKSNLAKELGLESMSDAEYVTWLAKTLGKQYGIMLYFGFDHGVGDGSPQLHPGNVSLAGEIFDLETSRFRQMSQRGIVFVRYELNNDMSIDQIRKMQEGWKEKNEQRNWLSILLDLAPEINFVDILKESFFGTRRLLSDQHVNPRKEIARFNRERWGPYKKGLHKP